VPCSRDGVAADAVADLAAILNDKNEEVRYRAAVALAALGPAAKSALPRLNAMAKEKKVERVLGAIRDAITSVDK
jgi:HEAT repeat protein